MKIKTHIEVEDKDFYKTMFELSHNHRMELEYDNALEYIKAIGQYNNFEYYKVVNFLEEMDKLIPRTYYNEGNPNNGKRAYKLSIGRESSPVIYVKLFFFSDVRNFSEVKQNWNKIKDLAYTVGLADEADMEVEESDVMNCKTIQMRFWYD